MFICVVKTLNYLRFSCSSNVNCHVFIQINSSSHFVTIILLDLSPLENRLCKLQEKVSESKVFDLHIKKDDRKLLLDHVAELQTKVRVCYLSLYPEQKFYGLG